MTISFSTREVARITRFSQQTVTRMFDRGKINETGRPKANSHGNYRRIPVERVMELAKNDFMMRSLLVFLESSEMRREDVIENHIGESALVGFPELRFHPDEVRYTTGEAAELSSVSQQTIIRSVDRGNLEGYRLPIGNKKRYVPADSLSRLVENHGIPKRAELIVASTFNIEYPGQIKDEETFLDGRSTYSQTGRTRKLSFRLEKEGIYISNQPTGYEVFLLGGRFRNGIISRTEHLNNIMKMIDTFKKSDLKGPGTSGDLAVQLASEAEREINSRYLPN